MGDKGAVYVLDEPTTGLHLPDVAQLLGLLDRLVDSGHDGGRIVFEGTPADLVAARSTLTGEHLAAYVGT